MPFNYFNPSDLAIGNKLKAVFHQLYQLADSAEENIEQFSAMQEFLSEYDNRNYRVARPTKPYNPCRSDEFFNILNDKPIYINKLYFDKDRKKVVVDVITFNRTQNRITRIEGESDLLEGYCVYKKASSNLNFQREAEFVEDVQNGAVLFKYRVGSDNTIILSGDLKNLLLTPYDCSHYTKLEHGVQLAGTNQNYVATDYMCICVVGNYNNIHVRINDQVILQGQGHNCVRYGIFYVKPGEVISGSYSRIFEIKYIINIPQPNKPATYHWKAVNEYRLDHIFEVESEIRSGDSQGSMVYGNQVPCHNVMPTQANHCGFTAANDRILGAHSGNIANITLKPETGFGFYDDEIEDISSIYLKGRSMILEHSIQGEIPRFEADIQINGYICDKDGNIKKSITGNYQRVITNENDNGYGESVTRSISAIPNAGGLFEITFNETKIPKDGYIKLEVNFKNATRGSAWTNYNITSGMKLYLEDFTGSFYKF